MPLRSPPCGVFLDLYGLRRRDRDLRERGLRRLVLRNGERDLEIPARFPRLGLRDLERDLVIPFAREDLPLLPPLWLLDSDMRLDSPDFGLLPRLRLLDPMRSSEGDLGRLPLFRTGLRLLDVSIRLDTDDLLLRRPRAAGLNELSLRLVFLSPPLGALASYELSEV